MQVQREFRPEVAQRLESIPTEELEKLLGIQPTEGIKEIPKLSKWAKIAQDAHETSPLSGLSEHVLECSKEFRESSEFSHDRE